MADDIGLLIDFFKHKVFVAVLARRADLGIEILRHGGGYTAVPGDVIHALGGDADHGVLGRAHNVPRVRQKRGNVRGEQAAVRRFCQYQGAVVVDCPDLPRAVVKHDGNGVSAAHLVAGGVDSLSGVVRFAVGAIHQVRQAFRVRFTAKKVALVLQRAPQGKAVVYNAVVDKTERGGAVGVGVFFGRSAVRCPTGVPDALMSREKLRVRFFLQL